MLLEHWFYTFPLRVRSLFRRARVEQELDEELQFHLERAIEQKIAHGLTPEQAQYAARRVLHGLEQRKEECRDMRKVRLVEDLMKDTHYALRMLRRNPAFSILAILCLTLGVGATTAVFSWVEGILLRPFPLVAGQDRLVAITGTDRSGRTGLSWPDFVDLRKNCTLTESFIMDRIFGTTLSIGTRAEHATASIVFRELLSGAGYPSSFWPRFRRVR
jgi:hypothetical protein